MNLLRDANVAAENLLDFSNIQFQLIAVLFMIGYGSHFAFSTFFLASSTSVAPKYRLVPWLSAVVMIAAGLSLLRESSAWINAFTFDGELWTSTPGESFSNAFRYANWTITIPLLLVQLLLALNLPRAEMYRRYARLVAAALLMVWTGMAGQFFEVTSKAALWIWFVVSSAFFVWLLIELRSAIAVAKAHTPETLHKWLDFMLIYMVVFWTFYAVGYIVPAFSEGQWAMFARQLVFTIADVFSKLVYGVILSRFVLRRSALDGHRPAVEALDGWPAEHVDGPSTTSA